MVEDGRRKGRATRGRRVTIAGGLAICNGEIPELTSRDVEPERKELKNEQLC